MNYFPFNRELVTNYVSDKGHFTITGLFITEVFKISTNEAGEFDPDEIINPQVLRPEYLMRERLDELNDSAFRHLSQNSWTHDQILHGLQVVRDYLWDYWESFIYFDPGEKESAFYTGSQAAALGPKSFKTWKNNSDPLYPFEWAEEGWFDGEHWKDKKPKSWLDIYALLSLWSIDESTMYLNSNDVFKAIAWLERASLSNFFFTVTDKMGKGGGDGKANTYDPLRHRVRAFAEELKSNGKWKSRRNTAMTIAPEIVEMSMKLGLNMSEQQAPITIDGWLKKMGFK